MNPTTITLPEARQLILRCQGLDNSWKLARGKRGAAQVIERLGYVQIDTISVVQRAHHHTLWTRAPGYSPGMLDTLQRTDRRVFEYWDHAASIVPMANYRYYIHRMKGFAQGGRTKSFLESNAALVKEILDRIKREGALGSSDFEYPEGRKRAGWWDWKPAKRALEELFNTGRLLVSHRVNFERKYDLPECVIPAGTDTTEPSWDDVMRFTIRRTLTTQGFIDSDDWISRNDTGLKILNEMIVNGSAVPLIIEGVRRDQPYYADPAQLKAIAVRPKKARGPVVHILSPFDNAIVARHRTREIFRFDYRLEAYFPQHKRKHGYFCLPVLWNDVFIGRIDAKAQRDTATLIVHAFHFEKSFSEFDEAVVPLAKRLHEFAAFNGCQSITLEKTSPVKYRPALNRALRNTVTGG